ncbi:MAG: S1 RNA-binding domain-containing protein, partial [Myxococcota bacterium]
SELSPMRVRHPSDVVKVGDTVTVRVLEFDLERRRLSLSLRERRTPDAMPARGMRSLATVDRHESFGVFVVLEGGGPALLPAAETDTPQGADLRRALPKGAQVEVMVIDVDDRGRVKVSQKAIGRAEEEAALQEHQAKGAPAGKGGFGTFADLLKKAR